MSLIPGFMPDAATKPHRSWKRQLAYGLLFLMTIFAAVVGWAYWRGDKVLRDAIAIVERTDPEWRIQQIEAKRRRIPDNENSALMILAGKKLIDANLRAQQSQTDISDPLDEMRRFPNASLNAQQKQCVTELLKPYRVALEEWKKIENMSYGRFPIKYSPDFIGTLLPGVQDARDAANTFRYELLDRVEANDKPGAVRAMKCLLNNSRALGDEPLLISMLVRIAIHAVANSSLEWLLAQLQLEEADLVHMQKALEEDAKSPIFTIACRGERAGSFETLEYMKRNRGYALSIGSLAGTTGGRFAILDYVLAMLPGSLSVHQADCLRYTNQAVEISKLPIERQADAFKELEKEVPNLAALARLLAPAMSKVSEANTRWQAKFAVPLLRWLRGNRIAHGNWPKGLSDLISEKLLAEIPLDPFDGNPLRWKVVPSGRLVYSVGKDRVDNGGHINPDNPTIAGSDMGFRLFDPDQRRQAPRLVKPKNPDPPDGTEPGLN